jgi:hypothetical protein
VKTIAYATRAVSTVFAAKFPSMFFGKVRDSSSDKIDTASVVLRNDIACKGGASRGLFAQAGKAVSLNR